MAVVTKPVVDRIRPARLVDLALSGKIRIPDFQRPFRWEKSDVQRLFDSIYRGYPVGNLLMWERPAPAAAVRLGPLSIEAPEVSDALWVVDGQQRVTSLVGALAVPPDAIDPQFRIFFDLRSREFVSASLRDRVHDSWLPMPVALRNQDVLRWQRERPWLAEEDIEACDAVVTAIRDYEIPVYVVGPAPEGNTLALHRYAGAVWHDSLASATRLLALLPAGGETWTPDLNQVKLNSAQGKINVLGLLGQGPGVLVGSDDDEAGDLVDVRGLLDAGVNPLAAILPDVLEVDVPGTAREFKGEGDLPPFTMRAVQKVKPRTLPWGQSLAARVIHRPRPPRRLLAAIAGGNLPRDVLRSQCLDNGAIRALAAEDLEGFLTQRTTFMRDDYEDIDLDHPVLGQAFEADPSRRRTASGSVPEWFANLLPERGSRLRDLIAREHGRKSIHDFPLLVYLGEDLPGAVRVVPEGTGHDIPELAGHAPGRTREPHEPRASAR